MNEKKVVNDTQEEVEDLNGSNEQDNNEEVDNGIEDEEDFDVIESDDLEDEEENEEETKPGTKTETETKQTKEDNAKYAAARREAEAKLKETNKELETLKSKFNSVLTSEIDDKQIAKWKSEAIEKGIDADFYVSVMETKIDNQKIKAERAITTAEKERDKIAKSKMDAEIDELKKQHNVDISTLMDNQSFKKFAKHKIGNQSLSEIYSDYKEIVGTVKETTIKNTQSKRDRGTGTGGTANSTLTPSQQRFNKEWNARYPNIPLNESDFKG